MPKNTFRCIAATSEPISNGSYREVLLCGSENVEVQGAHSVLFNHNRGLVIGSIQNALPGGEQLHAGLELLKDAKINGMPAPMVVARKALLGVSVGYRYELDDCSVFFPESEDELPVVTVRKWSLMEISLTPTPADLGAQIQLDGSEEVDEPAREFPGMGLRSELDEPSGPLSPAEVVAMARAKKNKVQDDVETREEINPKCSCGKRTSKITFERSSPDADEAQAIRTCTCGKRFAGVVTRIYGTRTTVEAVPAPVMQGQGKLTAEEKYRLALGCFWGAIQIRSLGLAAVELARLDEIRLKNPNAVWAKQDPMLDLRAMAVQRLKAQ